MIAGFLVLAARADVVGYGDKPCPNGAIAWQGHSGEICIPAECDENCLASCREVGLCFAAIQEDWTVPEAVGNCKEQADCPADTTCEVADRCAVADESSPSDGCGCAGASRVPAGAAFTVAAAAGLLLARSRRKPLTP